MNTSLLAKWFHTFPLVNVRKFTKQAARWLTGPVDRLSPSSEPKAAGKYGMGIFVALLLVVHAISVFGPLHTSNTLYLALSALLSFFLFAALAFWLDREPG